MKKDIKIPEVTDLEMAIILEQNQAFNVNEWIVYLINRKNTPVEMVVIVSQGFSKTKTTSIFIF